MRPNRACLVTSVGLCMVLAAAAELRAQAPAPPAAPAAAATSTAPLARYVPRTDRLYVLVEFDGLDAHADAWKATAAYKILNDTTTGAMLEDLVTQIVNQIPRSQPGATPALGGADAVAIAKFLAQQGFLIAIYGDDKTPDKEHGVMVFRGAARKENRAVAARLLGSLMGQGAKTQKAVREGRTVVEVTPATGRKSAWWTEKDDLVFLESADDADAILATLDGKTPSAVESPQRAALFEAEGPFTPLGGAMMDFDVARQLIPKAAKDLEGVPLRRIDFRVGLDGPALSSIVRVDVPAPRPGAWAILDQPLFDFRALPPIPNGVDGFTAFSVDLDRTYGLITGLVRQANPQAAGRLDSFEKLVQERTRRNLREDFLAPLGPKMVVYIAPGDRKEQPPAGRTATPPGGGAAAANNPLAALGGIGLQVPKFVFLAETNNPARFSRALDELIIFANRQMEQQFAAQAKAKTKADDDKEGTASRGRRKSSDSDDKEPDPPRFRMTSAGADGSPKTYLLRLPPQLAAMTNLNLTIAMGRKHVVIASAADVARDALALESGTEGRWTPQGDLAQALARLPEGRLMMLRVKDPRGSLPEGLANLPQTMTTFSTQLAQAAKGGIPGLAAPGGAAAPPGGANPPGGNINRRKLGITGADPIPSNAAAPEGNPGAAPGAAAPGAAALGSFRVTLDPAKAPKADQIRPLLFPGASALLVEDRGVRFVTRSAFPDFASPSGTATSGVMVALLLPAVQAAREAARNAAARNAAAITELSLKPGEQSVGRFAVTPPAEMALLPVPPTPPVPKGTTVQMKAWSTPKDPQGRSTTILLAIFSGPDPIQPQLDNFIQGYYNGLKRSLAASGLTDFSEDGRETVELNGRQFVLLTYSAGPDAQRHIMRGMAYITAEGNDALTLAGAAPDGQEPAMSAALLSVARSLRRGDIPGAEAPAATPPPQP